MTIPPRRIPEVNEPIGDIVASNGNGHHPYDDLEHTEPEPTTHAGDAYLPDEFWTARPALEHIRQAARSRLVAPDAVLGAVLARVAAISPHSIEIPAIVGSAIGLTFYAGIVGPPEAGKSAAAAVAAELVPAPSDVLDRLPIGSGEGMVEILFDLVDEDDGDGKKRKVKRQTKYAAIFHIDEGAVLSDLANRQGTTLLPTLRTAYSHGTLGNANASIERRRILDGRAYVYGITLGIQPELAGPLLADTAAGTPQRFVWVMATDPNAPDDVGDWPGPLSWQRPDAGRCEPYKTSRGGWGRVQLGIHPVIAAEVIADRQATMRGDLERSAADAHQTLVKLKTAALLAVLDDRLDVELDDWELAGVIAGVSRRIRHQVEGTLTVVARLKEQARADRQAHLEIHVESSKEAKALASATKTMANVVIRHHENGEHEEPAGCNRTCLRNAVAGKHKAVISVDDAITEAQHRGFIAAHDGRWIPGDARPA